MNTTLLAVPCNEFDDFSPENQRSTMVHELLHCHFAAISQHLLDASGNVGKTWIHLLDQVLKTHLEYGIDAIADALAKSMPLPPKPEKPKKRKKKATVA
jgi:hypothetical protein